MRISQEYLKSRLSYCPETGVFVWLPKRDNPLWSSRHGGRVAGTIQIKGNGYRRVNIVLDGKSFKAHRLAWLYVTGDIPPKEIDHKNRDATDNRWENIRDSAGLNQKNKSMQRNNKSGVTGVSWSKVSGKWAARVWGGAADCRTYKHLGLFLSVEAAKIAVDSFRRGVYDPNHGKFPTVYPTGATP
jgi:hypothetical protein